MRPRMGLLNIGTDSAGNALYMADADEDTSDYYQVGQDSSGNAIFSDNPTASATPVSTSGGLLDFLNAASSIYSTKTIADINAARARNGLPPATPTQLKAAATTKKPAIAPWLIIGGAAAMIGYIVMSGRKSRR